MLTADQAAQFHRDGYLRGAKVLDDAFVDRLRDELARVLEQRHRTDVKQPVLLRDLRTGEKEESDSPIWQIVNIWEASDAYRELIFHPRATEEVAQLTGANELRVWHDQIQFKPAGKGGVNMWHQDWPYWDLLSQPAQVTAWFALDDVDADNGCMSMVPGSHKWGDQIEFLHKIKRFEDMPREFNGRPIEVRLCPAKKGEVHYHHGLTWHGSQANVSERPRRAIAVHYMTENTCYLPGQHPMNQFTGHLARGQKIEGEHFPLVWQRQGRRGGGAAADLEPQETHAG